MCRYPVVISASHVARRLNDIGRWRSKPCDILDFKVIKEALTGHKGWKPAWREPDPKPHYDIVIIGGGGHGLATAHYLAKSTSKRTSR